MRFRIFSLTGLFLFLPTFRIQNIPSKAVEKKGAILFAIEDFESRRRFTIDPIARVIAGKPAPVPSSCDENDANAAEFYRQYMKPGVSYRVFFGGTIAGSVTLNTQEENSPDTVVTLNSQAKIGGSIQALATDSARLGRPSSSRREPTAEERSIARELVKRILRDEGALDASWSRFRLDALDATDLEADGIPELIGSAIIERADQLGIEHSVFFIASARGNPRRYEAVFTWYDRPESEVQGKEILLVDLIDLDGDGIDEVVTRLIFYENYRYLIFKREKNDHKWRKIFETETLGCL